MTNPPGTLADAVDAERHEPGHISPTARPVRKNERALIKNVHEQTRAKCDHARDRVRDVSGA
jgi:hypothetical protein